MPHPRACTGVCVRASLPRTEPPGTGHFLGGEHIGRGGGHYCQNTLPGQASSPAQTLGAPRDGGGGKSSPQAPRQGPPYEQDVWQKGGAQSVFVNKVNGERKRQQPA